MSTRRFVVFVRERTAPLNAQCINYLFVISRADVLGLRSLFQNPVSAELKSPLIQIDFAQTNVS